MDQNDYKYYPNGTQSWKINGRFHREDGPAIIYSDGTKVWMINGQLHREDGPAIIRSNGERVWYLYGVKVTPEEVFNRMTKDKKKEILFNVLDEWK